MEKAGEICSVWLQVRATCDSRAHKATTFAGAIHSASCCVCSARVPCPFPTPVVASISTARGGEREGVLGYVCLLFRYVSLGVTCSRSVCFPLDVLWGPRVDVAPAYPVARWLCVPVPTASCGGPHHSWHVFVPSHALSPQGGVSDVGLSPRPHSLSWGVPPAGAGGDVGGGRGPPPGRQRC